MNTRMVIGSFVATLIAFQGVAQRGENDDMYFNSKDREKLNVTASVNDKIDSDYKAFKKRHFDENEVVEETSNPTDSYSARTLNPEYISRSNSEQASEDEQNYYVEGYDPNTYDSYSSGNYNYNNNWNNNNWNYRNNWYGRSAYDSWYSPYYGYRDPWMSPYYSGGSGWTLSLNYTWGNAWNPGCNYGAGYGWSNSYYNPYSYYPSYYSNYGYPTSYYYGGSEPSRANYGKRPSRHSAVVTPTPRSISSNSSGSISGRTRQTSDEYYVKPSRRTATFENTDESTRDRYTKPSSTDNSRSRTRESYNNTRDSRPTYSTPSRSSSPSRSTPSKSSGSSSSSRSRKN